MADRNNIDRPITVRDLNKFRKGWIVISIPILKYCGVILVILGVVSIFLPAPEGTFTLPLTIILFAFGFSSIFISFWGKEMAKKIKV